MVALLTFNQFFYHKISLIFIIVKSGIEEVREENQSHDQKKHDEFQQNDKE